MPSQSNTLTCSQPHAQDIKENTDMLGMQHHATLDCVCVCVCDEYQSDPSTPIHGPSTICHPDLTFKRKSSVLVDRGSCPSTAANVLRV